MLKEKAYIYKYTSYSMYKQFYNLKNRSSDKKITIRHLA